MNNLQLYDSFGRQHTYLRISLTDACNLRCMYCMPEENYAATSNAKLMSPAEIQGIAEIFVSLGITKIRLTGGEPLVRQGAKEIIHGLSELSVELAITTNGYLIDAFIYNLQLANIKTINIGLDTLNADEFAFITRRQHLKKILNNINLLLEHDFNVKVNVVIMKGVNENSILDFVALTKEHQLSVRFIEFMPFAGNKWEWDKIVKAHEIIENIEKIFAVGKIEDKTHDTSRNYRVEGYKGAFGVISTMTEPFCAGCNRLRLTADGKLKNCLFSNDETDILSAFRKGEDIIPLINDCLLKKKKERAGIFDFEHVNNRAMIAIGG